MILCGTTKRASSAFLANLFLCALMVSAPVAADAPPIPASQLTLGGTSTASSYYAFHAAVSKALDEQTDGAIRMRVMETGGGVDNVNLLRQDRVDIAHVTSYNVAQSIYGKGPWEERGPDKRIRVVLAFNQSPQMIVVRADSGIEKLEDLDGKPFSAGFLGSSTAAQVKAALDTIGIKPDYKSVSLEDAIAKVQDGRLVGFAKSSAAIDRPDASLMRLMSTIDVNILSFTDEQLDTIRKNMPLLLSFRVPAGTYEDQADDYLVTGHISGYAANKSLDPDVVYQFWDAMIEKQELLESAGEHWPKRDFVDLTVSSESRAPLHLGAYRWLRDHGADIPESMIPPEAKQQ